MALEKPIYILSGSEPVRRRHLLGRLRAQAGEWENLSASEVEPESLLQGSLLLDPDRPVVKAVWDYSKWSTSQRKGFARAVQDGQILPGMCLVFCIDRLGPKDPLRLAVEAESIIQLEHPARGRYPQWVESQAKLSGLSLASGVAEFLVRAQGEDTEALASEIEKLSLLVGKEAVSLETAKSVVASSPQSAIWSWVDAVLENQQNNAIQALALCEEAEESPLALTGALQSRLLQLAWASQMSQKEAQIKDYPWRLAKQLIQKGWTKERIRAALLKLHFLERDLKGGSEIDGYLQVARLSYLGL